MAVALEHKGHPLSLIEAWGNKAVEKAPLLQSFDNTRPLALAPDVNNQILVFSDLLEDLGLAGSRDRSWLKVVVGGLVRNIGVGVSEDDSFVFEPK